jgi:hypothetical protein
MMEAKKQRSNNVPHFPGFYILEVRMKAKKIFFFTFFIVIIATCLNQINAQTPARCKYPEASSRHLTSQDLAGKSIWELKIMRNEIFARHGYKFKSEDMREYFNKQEWYKPEYDNVTSKLTEIEIANIKILKQYEDDLKKSKSSSNISELIEKQKREVVFKASWGPGHAELGRSIPQEANPEGPMSFTIDSSGKIFVLDQVNKRVLVFDNTGTYIKAIPIPTVTFSDIDIGESGNLFLLDKWRNEAVLLIDDKGNELKRVKLIGKGIMEVGGVTEIYSCEDGLWVTNENSIVRVCDASGEPYKDRQLVAGKFSSDGKYLIKARKIGDITVIVTRSMRGESGTDTYTVCFDIPVLYITLVDTDENGKIYLGVNLLEESIGEGPPPPDSPDSIENSHEIVVVLDSNGNEKRRIYMPVSTRAEEVNRSFRVTPDGTIYQLVIGEEGATMWRYCP